MTPFAEVIGQPVAHSLSPAIHRHWLAALGIDGDFLATEVAPGALAEHLRARRADPAWRGCSVTAPHKEAVLPLLDRVDDAAARIGAVNCVVRDGDGLAGRNTDVDGIAAALAGVAIEGRKVAMIGGGGAARAALACLDAAKAGEIAIVLREPARGEALRSAYPDVQLAALADADRAFDGAALVINASPMGLAGGAAMPAEVIAALPDGAALFDMVYHPRETALLAAGRARGLRTIDGLAMLIGQARAAFAAFFGADPPADDAALRQALDADPCHARG